MWYGSLFQCPHLREHLYGLTGPQTRRPVLDLAIEFFFGGGWGVPEDCFHHHHFVSIISDVSFCFGIKVWNYTLREGCLAGHPSQILSVTLILGNAYVSNHIFRHVRSSAVSMYLYRVYSGLYQ